MTTNFGLGFQTHILHAVFISIALKSNTLESFSSPTQKKRHFGIVISIINIYIWNTIKKKYPQLKKLPILLTIAHFGEMIAIKAY